jgi:molybdopterin molybdotransferase
VIAFPDAVRRIIDACGPLGTERIALLTSVGRVAAETIDAREDLVPFARSAMDGFAVRTSDLERTPVELPVSGRLYADSGETEHAPRTATAIATGAPIPRGADAVLPIEDVETHDGVVRIARAVPPGSHVFPPGEDARAGERIVGAGTRLRPSTLGLLAAAGHGEIAVYRKPRVAIVCTGDELVPVDATPAYGQIRNSNAPVASTTIEEFGGLLVAATSCADDRDALRRAFADALWTADLVVTTGGASVGERDLVKPILDELGVQFIFRTIALRPAKPAAFGALGERRIAVLPGNPSSAFIALQLLVRPALHALSGRTDALPPLQPARLEGRVRAKPASTFASYAQVRLVAGRLVARPLGNQCSALTRSASDADGFILVPPGEQTFETGATVDVDVFDWTNVGRSD